MSTVNLDEWLSVARSRVEGLLRVRMEALSQRTPAPLAQAMAYSLLDGGKRLRPVLCLAFSDVVRNSTGQSEAVADAACALECIHTYSLVHDDLPSMDDDALRRGRPTNHKVYGEAMAILAGDALLTDAFVLLSSGPENELAMRCRLVAELARAAGSSGMVGGQVLDIAEDRPSTLDYLNRLHRLKTGALIKAACRMGVIAAGGSDAALNVAEVYGEAVGLAFQIADDVLDVTASAAAMGKATQADAAAGRHTFPAVVGLEAAKQLAAEHVAQAISAVKVLEGDAGPLAALARYAIERSS